MTQRKKIINKIMFLATLESCIVLLMEKEEMGMCLRGIVTIPNGSLQSGQRVSQWGWTRSLKQLHEGEQGRAWLFARERILEEKNDV